LIQDKIFFILKKQKKLMN